MKIDDLLNEWKKDCLLDDLNLDKESVRIPLLHSKYIYMLADARARLRTHQIEKRSLISKLRNYYFGSATEKDLTDLGREQFLGKTLKNDISTNIEFDSEIIAIDAKISIFEIKISALEEIMKSLNARGYQIKNAIDWRRLTMGP